MCYGLMAYLIWIYEDTEARILDIKYQAPLLISCGQCNTYRQFQRIVGKKPAEAALRKYIRRRQPNQESSGAAA